MWNRLPRTLRYPQSPSRSQSSTDQWAVCLPSNTLPARAFAAALPPVWRRSCEAWFCAAPRVPLAGIRGWSVFVTSWRIASYAHTVAAGSECVKPCPSTADRPFHAAHSQPTRALKRRDQPYTRSSCYINVGTAPTASLMSRFYRANERTEDRRSQCAMPADLPDGVLLLCGVVRSARTRRQRFLMFPQPKIFFRLARFFSRRVTSERLERTALAPTRRVGRHPEGQLFHRFGQPDSSAKRRCILSFSSHVRAGRGRRSAACGPLPEQFGDPAHSSRMHVATRRPAANATCCEVPRNRRWTVASAARGGRARCVRRSALTTTPWSVYLGTSVTGLFAIVTVAASRDVHTRIWRMLLNKVSASPCVTSTFQNAAASYG
jgi:hypothetical protein